MLKWKKSYSSITTALLVASPLMAISMNASAILSADNSLANSAKMPDTQTIINQMLEPKIEGAGGLTSVGAQDIGKYISGFRARVETDQDTGSAKLTFIGLGKPACLRHFEISLDRPNDGETGVYGLRMQKHDLLVDGKPAKFEDDCTNSLKGCTRDLSSGCTSVTDPSIAGLMHLDRADAFALNTDTKILCRTEDMTLPKGDPTAIKDSECPKTMGGPLQYQTPATREAENQKKALEAQNQAIVSSCKNAEKGDADEYDNLVALLGPDKAAKDENFLKKLKVKCDEAGFEEITKKIDDAKDLETLNELIDEIAEYAKAHPGVKSKAVKALVDGIGHHALDLEADDGSSDDDSKSTDKKKTFSYENAKLKLIERALKVARSLDPRNQNLRQAHMLAKLKRFEFSAKTGSDAFYNNTTQKEAQSAYNNVAGWQSQSPNQYSNATLSAYQKTMAPVVMPTVVNTPYGPMSTYAQVSSLDRTYQAASMQEVYDAYLANQRGAGGGLSGLGGYSPSGGFPSMNGTSMLGMGKY